MTVSGSPYISSLDFKAIFDLSGNLPAIQFVNASTGSNLSACTWFAVITDPNGVSIHTGSFAIPDMAGAWGIWNMPDLWAPASHIIWSGMPYTVTLHVTDGLGHSYSLSYSATISAPCGNGGNGTSNNAMGGMFQQIRCLRGQVYAQDSTNYLYNSSNGSLISQIWQMRYPMAPDGTTPAIATVTGTSYAFFDISYNGEYIIYMNTVREYPVGAGAVVRINYKTQSKFKVQCSVDVCALVCCYQEFLKKVACNCDKSDVDLLQKLDLISGKLNLVLVAMNAGCMTIDVQCRMNELRCMFDNMGCCVTPNTDDTFPAVTGGAIIDNIIDKTTGITPAACPGSFYPADVYKPNGTTLIGRATNILDLLNLINTDPDWLALGRATYIGSNCQVGFIKNDGVGDIPPIVISQPQPIIISLEDICTGTLPAGCPGATMYPAIVYAPDGVTTIGPVASPYDVVVQMNSNAAWLALGRVAYNSTNCTFKFYRNTGITVVPSIVISSGPCCVDSIQNYILPITDQCLIETLITTFPFDLYVNYDGGGDVLLGTAVDIPSMIALLNSDPAKPSVLSYTTGTLGNINLWVRNSNCNTWSGTVVLSGRQKNYILFGANNDKETLGSIGGEWGAGVALSTYIGKIVGTFPPFEFKLWHSMLIDNGTKLLVTQQGSGSIPALVGRVFVIDITNPLMPNLIGTVMLTPFGGGVNNFLGIPVFHGGRWPYNLYFPTDVMSTTDQNVFVMESSTGTIWKIDVATMTVLDAFVDQRLRGLCPRIILGDNQKLYFTQDGALGTVAGYNIGAGQALVIDTLNFAAHSASISLLTIDGGGSAPRLVAASTDGGTIWFIGDNGNVYKYFISTGAITSVVAAIPLAYTDFVNVKLKNHKLYVSSTDNGTGILDVTSWPTVSWSLFANLTLPGVGSPNINHYNFLPINNCIGVLTFSDAVGHASGYAIYDLAGNFISLNRASLEMYNVVPAFPAPPPYTPTTMV